ncbi:HD domain-containing protein [Aquibacillus koreensis]|uniref:HD domain-containing protein n=1 Tax=Aquibacillus koreensis TaxID=279446 RepID=A0A9X3WJQ5_9BACI|nr:HD domain-containing phosphohydrolase [Aquibacillus koreensis]MCT2536317.1 HD domain-containing protein [Aquibacillus koreensis]MDC3421332.1 HD domain-containing protein [Aquibacillus koreensis]
MRLVKISEYNHHTMVLAKPIYDSKRRILLAAGRTIIPKIKIRLQQMGIRFLFIEDEVSKGIHIDDLIDMPTWTESIGVVATFHNRVNSGLTPDLQELQQVVKKLIDEVKSRPILILIPASTMPKELQFYAHTVNVAILSLITAKKMNYIERKLHDLALGCLLHDIGKMITDQYEKHPEIGFNYLRNLSQFSVVSAHIAYQHHETMDGKGFPRGLEGDDFLEMAQICGVANYYDNLIAQDQLPPHDAMEAIMASADQLYKHSIINAFRQSVPTYPPGTKVMVNGEEAIVTQINKHLQRPIVKVLSNNKELDLAELPTMMIYPN